MRLFLSTVFLFFAFSTNILFAQAVVINELMADNETAVADEGGDFDDWIELYNNSDVPMDVSDYGLSDDAGELGKYRIPDGTVIPADGYLIIWADDDQEQGPLHAQFRLSASGEEVFLTDPNNSIVDDLEYVDLGEDVSYARDPNGTGDFRVKQHSFGANNDTTTSTFSPIPASISFFPNPTSDFLNIQSSDGKAMNSVRLYNLQGILLFENTNADHNINIDLRSFPVGNLVLKIGKYEGVVVQKK